MKFNPIDFPIAFQDPERLDISAWISHIPFAMFLIDLTRPKILVELGTYTGVSYSAFCQAIRELNLDAQCYAVDTWKGDKHSQLYGNELFEDFTNFHDLRFGYFSTLIRDTFDNAVANFSDHSIDLLHIDGLHTYEAVKHDFETWLPKLSKRGVVLFHDTAEYERDFGVWKLWQDLVQNYPSFEFKHGHGLGMLAVGSQYPNKLDMFFSSSGEEKLSIRRYFELVGKGRELEFQLHLTRTSLEEENQRLLNVIQERDRQLFEIHSSLAFKVIILYRSMIEKILPEGSLGRGVYTKFINGLIWIGKEFRSAIKKP